MPPELVIEIIALALAVTAAFVILVRAIGALGSNIVTWSKALNEHAEEREKWFGEKRDIILRLDEAEDRAQDADRALAIAQQDLADLREAFHTRIDAVSASFEEQIELLKAEREQLLVDKKKWETDYAVWTQERETWLDERERLQSERERLRVEREELRTERDQLIARIAQLEQEVKELQRRLNEDT